MKICVDVFNVHRKDMQSQIVLCVVQEISIAAPSDSTMFQEIRLSRPGVGHSCGLPDRRQAAAGLATNRECWHSGSACVHPSHLPQNSRASGLEKMHPLWGFLQDSETAQANEQLEEQKKANDSKHQRLRRTGCATDEVHHR